MSIDLVQLQSKLRAEYGDDLALRKWFALGSNGGFSGAMIWRGEAAEQQPVAVKAWPLAGTSSEHLTEIHRWMIEAKQLHFVPEIFRTAKGATFFNYAGYNWDLTQWMNGEPIGGGNAGLPQIGNVMAALAQLHCIWRSESIAMDGCPGLLNRLHLLSRWPEIPEPKFLPVVRTCPELFEVVQRAWKLTREFVPIAEYSLRALVVAKDEVPAELARCEAGAFSIYQ